MCQSERWSETVYCPRCGRLIVRQGMKGGTGVLVKPRCATLLSDKDVSGRLSLEETDTSDDLT